MGGRGLRPVGMRETVSLVIIGAGAAGLFAAAWAGRTRPGRRIVVLDSARSLGAKIIVSGGGRCNVTHDVVDETAYAGASQAAIRKILRRFGVDETKGFFREQGVPLRREEGGKLFPVTNTARTVLDALLRAVVAAGAELCHPRLVNSVTPLESGFLVQGDWGEIEAERVILAMGGRSLPKSGSDGSGHALAKSLGHSLTPLVSPALVPLVLSQDSFVRELSGLTLPMTLEIRSSTGKRLISFTKASPPTGRPPRTPARIAST